MKRLDLAEIAKSDLRSIRRYSTKKWGIERQDIVHCSRVEIPFVLKDLDRCADLSRLQQAAPSGGDEQGSRP